MAANGRANSFLGEALDSLIEKDFKEDYAVGRRVSGLKGKAETIRGLLISKPSEAEEFNGKFHDILVFLEKAIVSALPLASATDRQLWKCYHEARSNSLPMMWEAFGCSFGVNIDPILQQMINDKMFANLVTHLTPTPTPEEQVRKRELKPEEKVIIRYISGFIPQKLIKKYANYKSEKYAIFTDCLIDMSLLDCSNDVLVSDDDFLEYTKQWTTIRSRGGLYEVKDETFLFFQEVELVVQAKLEAKLAYVSKSSTAENFKDEIYQAVLADEVVLFHWSLLAVHLDDETLEKELLHEVIEMWITIRGFSIVNEWMEKLKWQRKSSSSKAKGLRKGLQQTDDNH